ncbi:MAG: serine protease, partial [Gemmatimonadales bacterium]
MINQENVNRQAEVRLDERKTERVARSKQLDAMKSGKGFNWKLMEDVRRLTTRARRLGFVEAAGALLRDPEDIEAGNRIFEQIIDANNLLGVTFLSEGTRMSRAVGRILLPVQGGTRLGTGFMVSPRVMMTNNHVLGDAGEASRATIEFDFFTREDGTIGPVIRFRLQPEPLFVTDALLDFTLVAVEAINSNGIEVRERGWFPLVGPSGKAVVGERVSIIQHPNGEPQKITVHDNKVVDVDGAFLHYETDTMGGSSGSPVLNIGWDLAALHHAAVGKKNEGVRISSIVTKLGEIFSDESAGEGPERAIVAELMAAGVDPLPGGRGSAVVPPASAPALATALGEGPRINPDGSASWIVPISVTVGVGQSCQIQTPPVSKPD